MIDRHGDPRRPAAPIQEQSQPDPMLQTGGGSPLRGWVVILAAVVVLCLVLYGLNAQRPEQAASGGAPAAGTPAASPQTTGQAPAPASPRPAGQSKSGNQGEAPGQTTR